MAKKRKAWSKWINEAGLRARLFRWGSRPVLYYDYVDGLTGERRRRSTKRISRKEADKYVRAVLRGLAKEGERRSLGADVTLGTVFALYFEHKAPYLTKQWRKAAQTRRDLFGRAWGVNKRVADIGQADVDRFVALRRAGSLAPEKTNVTAVRDGTIEADLRWISTVFRWARGYKANGRPLVHANPMEDTKRPREANVRRPIASHERFLATMGVVDEVDPDGRLRCMLALARYTGRRENAICQLRASDFLRTKESVGTALAELGLDEGRAAHFPNGGLRWRAEYDKQGVDSLTPLSAQSRAALDTYLERNPRLGDVPLFPAPRDASKPIRKDLAGNWLMKAEGLAKQPKLRGTRWHGYRRLFATELKSAPVQDVAAAGGWKSIQTVQRLYQQPEAKGVLDAIEQIASGGAG
jgi:hypothetical protein